MLFRSMKEIQKKISAIDEYKQIVYTVPEEKDNKLGSAFNRIIISYENQILQHLVRFLAERNIEICTLMFDGLLIYGDFYNEESLIAEIESYIERQIPGLNMKWTYKKHDNTLKMPEDFDPNTEIIFDNTYDKYFSFTDIEKYITPNNFRMIGIDLVNNNLFSGTVFFADVYYFNKLGEYSL